MANIEDYIVWRGELSVTEAPFTNVDNLILSNLSYLIFRNVVPELQYKTPSFMQKIASIFKSKNSCIHKSISVKEAIAMMNLETEGKDRIRVKQDISMAIKLAKTKRFGNMRLLYYVDKYDEKIETQFSAITILMEDKTAYIAFRGTDTTLIGWKEDFNMSFMEKIPAQAEALKYLQQVSSLIKTPLRIGGHSKGGNLAVYSAMHIDENTQQRIINIYNNDGPGFHLNILNTEEYKKIKDKIITIIPQTSIVGMLLEHEEDYIVVKSSETLIMQHDPYSWEVMGDNFIEMNNTSSSSKIIDNALRQWLYSMTLTQREKFVDILWDILGAAEVKTFPEIIEKFLTNSIKIGKKYNSLDQQSKEILTKALSSLLKSTKNAVAKNYFK